MQHRIALQWEASHCITSHQMSHDDGPLVHFSHAQSLALAVAAQAQAQAQTQAQARTRTRTEANTKANANAKSLVFYYAFYG